MSRITRVDIPAADAAMNNLGGITERFEDAIAAMKCIAAELDGCWGDDKFGQKFAANYLGGADELLAGADESATALKELEAQLRKIAGMFQALDEDSGGVLELTDE
jgi:uncharacterized protein YukE